MRGSTRNAGQRWRVRGRGGVRSKSDQDFARAEVTGGELRRGSRVKDVPERIQGKGKGNQRVYSICKSI